MGADLLLEALYYARPVERHKGRAQALYGRYHTELQALLEREARSDVSMGRALLEVSSGRLFGVRDLLARAAREFAAIVTNKKLPTVLIVGEIYVRCDPFANDFVIDKLEERGIRCRFAAFNEWLEYMDHINIRRGVKAGAGARVSNFVQNRVQRLAYEAMAKPLGWAPRTRTEDSIAAADGYVRPELIGEAILTVGGALHEYRDGMIDGTVAVGPLECMPNKISEAQFFHVGEREGLLSLTLSLNGDPVDPEVLDNFAFEVHSRFQRKRRVTRAEKRPPALFQAPLALAEDLRRSFPIPVPLPPLTRRRVSLPIYTGPAAPAAAPQGRPEIPPTSV